ncbi:hypothetical protein SKAU_G00288670 [Synaphobranchus kaupii]|uniref:C3H1-type domain-containing protein n=1 Tax=Synaphobranchus kaupii TaxID=118154 RepID=A0A9Q1ETH7_SYNKA|nr:hypothetical protein SKAU_G00288670 [Synaphobranchus kaupii]
MPFQRYFKRVERFENNSGTETHGNMSNASQDRSSRWADIQKGLQFIQSTLPFPGSQEQYEVFIQELVTKLFGEGNDIYNEGEWARSVELYTEALSIAEYADSEDICISSTMMEKLYANRAAAYLNIGLHDQALEDCDKALQLNEGNHRALYRKARSLKELERHKEAYEAVAKCSLAVPQDPSVIKLTQELAKMLGLKIRKAYVRSKPALNVLQGSGSSEVNSDKFCQGSESVEDIEMVPQHTQEMGVALPGPSSASHPFTSEKAECESAPVSAMSSVSPIDVHNHEKTPMALPMTTPLTVHVATPMTTPVVTPPLVNGARTNESYPVPESRLDYDTDIIGDDLDELLDREGPSEPPMTIPTMKGPVPLPTSISSSNCSALHMPSHHSSHSFVPVPAVNLPPLYHKMGYSPLGLDSYSSPLDSLDSLSISESQTVYGQASFMPVGVNDAAQGPPIGMGFIVSEGVDLAKNPLADTHEFKQACCSCCIKTGPGLLDYSLYADDHKCKKDVLLGRIKLSEDRQWKPIRPRPTNQYVGPYYICKDVAAGGVCRYQGHCTFAYCQEEIDVWTLERKDFIQRDLLFDPFGANGKVNLTVPKILQENHGTFVFLCGVCFDHKPRIISKRNKDSPTLCSHPISKHGFEDSKCLVHILRETTLRYSKIRPYVPLQCQLDLCRHEVRYGCVREDACFFAHSLIELKVWMMQHELGIAHESIVLESRKYWNMEASSQGIEQAPSVVPKFGPPNLKMQFVCSQCWRNGQVSEPDKNKKYCTAKARHQWSKDRRVVLVSSLERKKWTTIRPLPTKKPIPSQFEICLHVAAGKKCQYIGNCSFAHSSEERDLWTYMKDNNIPDMEQLYELWLQSQKPGWSEETSNGTARENGKQIHMPTDYAEEVAGNHCWLCGKNCNSDKQWQQHITSEKHKDKVFNSEDDQNCWQYRFPTGTFIVCERFLKGTCLEEEGCRLAHGTEELREWQDRREFLLMKLAKARKDHLIAPNDNDFGKYSFLLKDVN